MIPLGSRITDDLPRTWTEGSLLDTPSLARLETYCHRFADVLTRTDQRERLAMYLRGLLDGPTPKNAEAIAARLLPGESSSALAQALQHFLSTSPWDSERFLACYRSALRSPSDTTPRLWVVHDVIFPKKGRHSVGAQRQFARTLGRKLNCQIAVFVSELNHRGFFPLAARLYLPGYWLREHHELAERLVPDDHRYPRTRAEIAIHLIDQLRREDLSAPLLTGDLVYLGAATLQQAAEDWQMQLGRPSDSPAEIDLSRRHLEEFLLADDAPPPDRTPDLLADAALAEVRRHVHWLNTWLGLDQFEGRNWLGWHHHVALVLAAYGFLASERRGPAFPPFPGLHSPTSFNLTE